MKRSFIILCALACICACTKEEEKIVNEPEIDSPSLSELSFNFKINHYGIEDQTTKAVKSGWEDGDVVYVFFSTVTAPKYLKMTYDGATWSSVEMNGASEGSIGLTESGTMTAVFLPFANSATISADGEAFSFSKQDYAYYLTCVKEPYTVSGNSVSGTLNMSVPDRFVQFFITDSDASDGILTLSEDHMTPSAVTGVAADGSLSIDNKSKGENMSGYAYGEGAEKGYLFSGILSVEARNVSTNYHFIMGVGGQTKLLDGTKTLYRGTEGNYTHRAIKLPAISSWSVGTSIPEIVDLGLPSGIKWASFNIGASAPEEYGDYYYAWGETEPNSGYSWDNYKWCNRSYNTLTKYNTKSSYGTVDNKTVLDPEDDVAHVKLGGNWRMPTYAECTELLDNCTWTWVDNYNGSGINGRLVTSKTNGNSIFLPAAGVRNDTNLSNVGSNGYYWSSSLDTDYPGSAWDVNFGSNYLYRNDRGNRFYGISVRPVSE